MKSIRINLTPETAETFEKMTFEVSRFPHLEYVINSTDRNEKLIALLNEKKVLLGENSIDKTPLQLVNDAITLIEIDERLGKLHKQLDEKKKYYQEFTEKLLENIKECNENLTQLLEKAIVYTNDNEGAKTNEKVADLNNAFESVWDKDLNVDWESRIVFYLAIKRILKHKSKKK